MNGDAIRTKASGRYREGGRSLELRILKVQNLLGGGGALGVLLRRKTSTSPAKKKIQFKGSEISGLPTL